MFQEQVRALIERQCRLLHDQANRLGWILADADPDDPASPALDVSAARRACARVLHRAETLGLDTVHERATTLDASLAALERHQEVRSWHMCDLMGQHAALANAVDEVEAEDTTLYSDCASASAVAPPPAFI
ncbi:MAG TPA: hypothetical protein VMM55_02875 [Thermohalobaculum sp.]|nr:hypothetical protein [Thermohalobaculum sp.]